MKFKDLTEEQQITIEKEFQKKYSNSNINFDTLNVDTNNNFKFSVGDKSIEVPIGSPDQESTNMIWKIIAGAAVLLGAVYIGSKIKEDGIITGSILSDLNN